MEQQYTCRWCDKTFTRERTLASHMCERKRRWMSSDEPTSRIAFQVWYDFMHYVSPQTKKDRTVEEFIRSADYLGFVKFANYLIELRPIESDRFIKWLFKMGVRLQDWSKPGTYGLYVQEASKKETAERAVERAVLVMKQWSEQTGEPWQDFFQKVPAATAMNMIVMGRISPWVLYSCDAAQRMLDRMEPGQLETIARSIDTEWWIKKIKKNPSETAWISTLLTDVR